MTVDNNTGKNKEFYERGRQMFDRIKPLNERSQTKPSSKRTWVGLTDEEASWCQAPSTIQTWKRIEAKLKEKNT